MGYNYFYRDISLAKLILTEMYLWLKVKLTEISLWLKILNGLKFYCHRESPEIESQYYYHF